MKRLFWVAVGAAGGTYVAHRVAQARAQLTPEAVGARAAEQASAAGGALRAFVLDVRTATRTREAELRQALGIEDGDDGSSRSEGGPAAGQGHGEQPGAAGPAHARARGAHRRGSGADPQRLDDLLGRPGPGRFAKLPADKRVRPTPGSKQPHVRQHPADGGEPG